MCFQTAKAQEQWLQSLSGHKQSPNRGGEGGARNLPGTCQSLRSRIRAQRVKLGNGGSDQQGQGQKGTAVVLILSDAATPDDVVTPYYKTISVTTS